VAQVRFPRLTALTVSDDAAKAIAATLVADYPLLSEGRDITVTLTPEGVSQQPGPNRTWQLQDAEQEWQVTFGGEFVSVHTSAYTKRDDFIARLAQVAERFVEVVRPPFTERVGVRYINRLDESDLPALPKLVRKEMLGGLAVPTAEHGVAVTHTLSEALYDLSPKHPDVGDGLHVRWGQLPPGAVLDPVLPAVDAPTWVLDLDSFRVRKDEFSSATISAEARELADRAYRFFRWAVTEEFLLRFDGGT
jgi:uncharacterized protein (TIGR04255 family)